jgi:hypothetical protein
MNMNETLLNCSTSIFTELESKLGEIDLLKEKADQNRATCLDQQAATAASSSSAAGTSLELAGSSDSLSIEPLDKDFALRQAQMQVQLTEYDSELATKEHLFRQMMENNQIEQAETRLTVNMDELKCKIKTLEKEKEELQNFVAKADSKK